MSYFNRKEKWWFHAIRAINLFAFRFWWLILFFFLVFTILFYLFCWQKKDVDCSQVSYALKATKEAISKSANCENCSSTQNLLPCDYQASQAGGQGYHVNVHALGDNPGKVVINYDMFAIVDKMDVYYDNQLVASTNQFVSGTGILEFNYPATPEKPKNCKIVLSAPDPGTNWQYMLHCPR
jgi:hypothetical protein